ncbi:MAG TPA: tRNA lysidine(34) synthetase TilS [Stenomitos sp.]
MGWTPLHATVHQTLRQRQLLSKGDAVLLAFSAGQDSLCLLQILRDLQPKWGWRLAIAHCDHGWPLDSHLNAAHVAQLAQTWELEHYAVVAPQVLKGEAEGRHWRYETLTQLAHQHGFTTVITAHTASDRAETLLLNLLRGSGMDGLQALVWQRSLSASVRLVRPLLAVTRSQTGEFCSQYGLPVWQDMMNQDQTYRRNRVRLELLPVLKTYNPQVELVLAGTAELLQAETAYLQAQAEELLRQARIPDHDLPVGVLTALDCQTLKQSALALQRRALRLWLTETLHFQPQFEQVEKTIALLRGNSGDRTDPFVRDIVAEVQRPWLCLRSLSKP